VVHRLRFGEGQDVEVPMFESFAHFMAQEHLFGDALVPPVEPAGYPRQLDPARQPFPTADGHISIVPYTDAALCKLFALMGAYDLLTEERFASPRARMGNISQAYREIAARTPARSSAEWAALLAAHQIPAMPVRDLAELTQDPHLVAVGLFQQRVHPTEGGYRHLRAPVRFSVGACETGPAPLIGQDNADLGAPPL
jgi:crotonobetainyl-CoA:carnitine CoA-transferase CaiB-like acyl-CoA transferase